MNVPRNIRTDLNGDWTDIERLVNANDFKLSDFMALTEDGQSIELTDGLKKLGDFNIESFSIYKNPRQIRHELGLDGDDSRHLMSIIKAASRYVDEVKSY